MLGLTLEKQIGGEGQALPITSKKEFLEIVGQTAHREMVARVRHAKTKEEKDKWKTPKYQLSMHWAMAIEDAMKLTEVKTFVNRVFIDYDHLTDQGTTAEELIKKMVALQAETGQLYGDISLSQNGVHGVFRYHPEWGSYLENIEHWDKVFGMQHDEFCETPRKGCFIPNVEDIYILEDALFEDLQEVPYEQLVPSVQQKAQPEQKADIAIAEATEEDLKRFDHYVEAAHLQADNLDVLGHRHENLMDILNAGVCKLLNKEKLMACLAVRMPSFINTKDCNRILNKWYDDYEMDLRPRSKSEKDFINSLHTESQQPQEQKQERLWEPPALPKKLPRLLELDLKGFPKQYHETLAVAHSPLLAAHASHYRTTYIDDKTVIAANTYVAVTTFSQNGKSQVTDLKKQMLAHTLEQATKANFAEHKKVKEMRNNTGSSNDKVKECKLPIYVCETVSESSFLKLMDNVGEEGMIFCFYPEADLLATKSAKGNLNEIIKEAWDGDVHNQKYATDAAVDFYGKVRASILTLGTAGAVIGRYFGQNNNGESGTRNRFMTVSIPNEEELSFLPPKGGRLTPEEEAERDGYLSLLWQQNLALKDDIKMLDMPKTAEAVSNWLKKWQKKYKAGFISEDEGILVRRVAQSMMRTAIPFVALNGAETKEVIDYILWLGDYVFYYQCKFFSEDIKHERELSDTLLKRKHDKRYSDLSSVIYQYAIGTSFTLKEYVSRFEAAGGTYGNAKKTLNTLCKKDVVMRIGTAQYQRIA